MQNIALITYLAPFWAGMHAPKPLSFDIEDPLHFDFVVAAAHLRGYTLGILESKFILLRNINLLEGELKLADGKEWAEKLSYIKSFLSKLEPRAWTPTVAPADTKSKTVQGVQQEISEATSSNFISDEEVENILSSLPNPSEVKGVKLTPIDFEKVIFAQPLLTTKG